MDVLTSSTSVLGAGLLTAALAACSPLGPAEVLVQAWATTYMYEGETLKVTNTSVTFPELDVTVTIQNLGTGGTQERRITVSKTAEFKAKIDAQLIPDLESGPAVVPAKVVAEARGFRSESRFAVVRDREARFPPYQGVRKLEKPTDLFSVDPWAKAEDTSLMEDVALGLAYGWGGRNLTVSRREATSEERSRLPGASTFLPDVPFEVFDIAGTFPKHVVPAPFTGGAMDVVATPKTIRAVMPQVRNPAPVEIRVSY